MSYFSQTLLTLFYFLLTTSFLQAQENATLLGHKKYDEKLNDIWGYVAPNGTEYALVGTRAGFSIVDISNENQLNEVKYIEMPRSTWRDIKTWDTYAYVVSQSSNPGLYIVDLSNAPDSISYTIWYGDPTVPFLTAHNIWIDENGIAYLFAANTDNRSTLMLDLKNAPLDPTIVGTYEGGYVHDGFVRGDTMWTAEINAGTLNAIDVSDKANPVWLGGVETPNRFTHNCWVTSDNKVAFTTDEKEGSSITAYDVSDVTDIKELDQTQSNKSINNIPHNSFVYKNWLLTSYYNDGISIHDITYPDQMIQIGDYDTSPYAGNTFNGAWGVYPFLPSEKVLVSDIEEGLFVLDINYIQACYLHGNIKNAQTGEGLSGVQIRITDKAKRSLSTIAGDYKTAVTQAGRYELIFEKHGFESQIFTDISLSNGLVTQLDVNLSPSVPFELKGQIVDEKGQPINTAHILLSNEISAYTQKVDETGSFSFPSFHQGIYDTYVGAWGYKVAYQFSKTFPFQHSSQQYVLEEGTYQDEFILDYGWGVLHNSQYPVGKWVRGEPTPKGFGVGRDRPPTDSPDDLGNSCFLTGNENQYTPLIQGETMLISPPIDLSDFNQPELSYSLWFSTNSQSKDSLNVFIYNGQEEILLETINYNHLTDGQYRQWHKRVLNLNKLPLTKEMRIRFSAQNDSTTNSSLSVGIDAFQIKDLKKTVQIPTTVKPNPFTNYTIISLNEGLYNPTNPIIRVFNTMGQQIISQKMNDGQAVISGRNLAPGIYLYTIEEAGKKIGNGKIIAQ